MSVKAVFLDKDGTLIENLPYNVDPDRIRLAPGAPEALRQMQDRGYLLFVVSNQSGVARGYFDEAALGAVEARLQELLAPAGVALDGFYYCPHHPQGSVRAYAVVCTCRKPRPGLIQRAAAEHRLDLGACWMIGDILDDVEAGRRAGCRTVLVDRGHETGWETGAFRQPHVVVRDLLSAARAIAAESAPEMEGRSR